MPLNIYNKKRDFKKTSEPVGKQSNTKTHDLFIIQKHAASHLHYDFRLELNGVLLSWAIPKGPCLDPSVKRLAMQTEDHPIEYGSFEGIIPQGEYGGGTVMLWDTGAWKSEDPDPIAAYRKGHLRFTLKAKKLNGRWSLIKFKGGEKNAWFLIKVKDECVKSYPEYDITLKKPNSVVSDLSMEEITDKYHQGKIIKKISQLHISKKKINVKGLAENPMPLTLSPQLATLVDEAPVGSNWIHEIKFDGYRMLSFVKNKKIKLISRNGKEWSDRFPNVIKELKLLNLKNTILDGEIVVLDKNSKSDFQLLQTSLDEEKDVSFVYYVFDIIYYDKYNLMPCPLIKRKEILKDLMSNDKNKTIRYSDHVIGSGDEILKNACKRGLEGIISKDLNSTYIEKRSISWLKVKCLKRQEVVIGGYTKPQGSRNHFGALLLGYYHKNKLHYCGKVGTGFSQASLKTLHKQLQSYTRQENPFSSRPPGYKNALWTKPELVCEIEFTEWTNDGMMRHPTFKGLRVDKKACEVVQENPLSSSLSAPKKIAATHYKKSKKLAPAVDLTHPDKILYLEDKITKLDIATYYDAISEWILPYIINRPLTLVRCPENYSQCFYQKHINNTTPKNLYGVKVKEKEKTEKCIYIKDYAGLMAIVQMGTLEIHPWGSNILDIEHPNIITFDLDPSPEIKWKKIVDTAFLIKDYLTKYKLKSFVKTTGGKGLHIVVPILPEYPWEIVKNFCHVFVKYLVDHHPGEFIDEMSKQKRKNKIFLDYLRNQRGATSVAVYSTRARIHAPVSTPIAWEELTADRKDTYFTIGDIPERLEKIKKDPWKDFLKIRQSLKNVVS